MCYSSSQFSYIRDSNKLIKMDIIVDVQGFKRPDNLFVLKELATVSIQRGTDTPFLQELNCYLFQPPCKWARLPSKYKAMNSWLIRNFHGLSWDIGDLKYTEIKEILHKLLDNKYYIYVKGLEKKYWIEEMVEYSKPVINVEDLDCPSLKNLKTSHACWNHHAHQSLNNKFVCALENVQALKTWYSEQSELISPSVRRSLNLYSLLGSIKKMAPEDISMFPKNFLINFESNNINDVWNKLPQNLQRDNDIINYRKCYKHYENSSFDATPLIKDCIYCKFVVSNKQD